MRGYWAFFLGLARANSPYSFSLTTFDPTGRLQQIEHAFAAVDRSTMTTAAIVADDGVVVCSTCAMDKKAAKQQRFLGSTRGLSSKLVSRVDGRIVASFAGMRADFACLVRELQAIATDHEREFGVEISVADLADRVGAVMQEHTQMGGARPFGVSLVLAGPRDAGFELFCVDPSGWVSPWRATAVGKKADAVRSKIAKLLEKRPSLTVDAALALLKDLPELKNSGACTFTIVRSRSSQPEITFSDADDLDDTLIRPSQEEEEQEEEEEGDDDVVADDDDDDADDAEDDQDDDDDDDDDDDAS